MAAAANQLILEMDKLSQDPAHNVSQPESLTGFPCDERGNTRHRTIRNVTLIIIIVFNLVLGISVLLHFIHCRSSLSGEEPLKELERKLLVVGRNESDKLLNSLNKFGAELRLVETTQDVNHQHHVQETGYLRHNLTQHITEFEALEKGLKSLTESYAKLEDQVEKDERKISWNANSTKMLQEAFEKFVDETKRPKDCQEIHQTLNNSTHSVNSTIHTIFPFGKTRDGVDVKCDFTTDGGGWTVIQSRGSGPRTEFYRDWDDYETGFGSVERNYWIGLRVMRALTTSPQTLRVELGDWEGTRRYAVYSTFAVSDAADSYRLSVSGYSGNAADSFSYHNNMQFSTRDRDHDKVDGHCAQERHGAWWYNDCAYSNLNGYYWSQEERFPEKDGIIWYHWKENAYSLKTTEMKIRGHD